MNYADSKGAIKVMQKAITQLDDVIAYDVINDATAEELTTIKVQLEQAFQVLVTELT